MSILRGFGVPVTVERQHFILAGSGQPVVTHVPFAPDRAKLIAPYSRSRRGPKRSRIWGRSELRRRIHCGWLCSFLDMLVILKDRDVAIRNHGAPADLSSRRRLLGKEGHPGNLEPGQEHW